MRFQKFSPAGPSGRCGCGTCGVLEISSSVFGSLRLPGLPSRRFCSVGFGGRPTGLPMLRFEVVVLARLRVDWAQAAYLLPPRADDVAVFGIEFDESGGSAELMRGYECGAASAEWVEDDVVWSSVVDD